jgi:hypothetical protein
MGMTIPSFRIALGTEEQEFFRDKFIPLGGRLIIYYMDGLLSFFE